MTHKKITLQQFINNSKIIIKSRFVRNIVILFKNTKIKSEK